MNWRLSDITMQVKESRYIRRLERSSIKFTLIYKMIILILYGIISASMSFHFFSDNNSSNDIFYTVIPIIVVSIIGVFSKNFYINMLEYIFEFDSNLITLKVKRHKIITEMYINLLTINTLLIFVINLIDESNLFLILAVSILVITLFLFLGIAAIFELYENLSKIKRKRY